MRVQLYSLALVLLGGCADAAEDLAGEAPVAGSEIRLEDATTAEEALPEGFSLPADTRIASNMKVSMANGEGFVILLDSTRSPEDLENHFRSEAEAAGFAVSTSTNPDGQQQLAGLREDGMQFDFAAALHTDGTTRGSLAVGREDAN